MTAHVLIARQDSAGDVDSFVDQIALLGVDQAAILTSFHQGPLPLALLLRLAGDQASPCAGSRARVCPVPGHPCLDGVEAGEALAAVERLAGSVPLATGATVGAGRPDQGVAAR